MIVGSVSYSTLHKLDRLVHPTENKMEEFVILIVPSIVSRAFFVFDLYKVAQAKRRPAYSEVMKREVGEALDRSIRGATSRKFALPLFLDFVAPPPAIRFLRRLGRVRSRRKK